LVYNTCWEDPRIDREALQLGAEDRVLVITSAGCNALDYLLAGAKQVLAVDMNPRQNALLELKVVAARALSHENFFSLFGRGFLPNFAQLYRSFLRAELSFEAQQFWDRHTDFFANEQRSFYFRGTSGYFARLINHYIDYVARVRDELCELCSLSSHEEQRDLYDKEVAERFWKPMLSWFLGRDLTLALLGVPPAQRAQVEQSYPGGIARFIQDAVTTVFRSLPLHDNYFWQVYLRGCYLEDCCPEYLKRENFGLLQRRLAEPDALQIHTTTVESFLRSYQGRISRFVLLDHMDWLQQTQQAALQREWQQIVDHAAPHARAIWRSGGLHVDYVDPIAVRICGEQVRMGELLSYQRKKAERLHARDRVHTYGSFYIADIAA
jgi:S-adenosylmethionine-diacylglycerol 3-amino-3-carboxypropyl transferase